MGLRAFPVVCSKSDFVFRSLIPEGFSFKSSENHSVQREDTYKTNFPEFQLEKLRTREETLEGKVKFRQTYR